MFSTPYCIFILVRLFICLLVRLFICLLCVNYVHSTCAECTSWLCYVYYVLFVMVGLGGVLS